MVPLQSWRAEAYKVCANRQPGREWGGGKGGRREALLFFGHKNPSRDST